MMIVFFLINALVFQQGDTLIFMEQDSVLKIWFINEDMQQADSSEKKLIRKTKVSLNNKFFLIYEEKLGFNDVCLQSKIIFYDANRKELWRESRGDTRKMSYDLSNVYDSLFIIVDWDKYNKNPTFSIIKNKKKNIVIQQGEWKRIVNYKISPNCRYLVFHTKNPYSGKLWDYIYFIDLKTKKNWEYLFPMCLSCKRYKIDLDIDDNGEADVIYRGEHRIFSKEGKLINIFIKFE